MAREAAPVPHKVMRQDDNGQVFEVARCASEEEAEAMVARFTARGHKQFYWAEPVAGS
ncbi:MAG: SPOR domain-containing protein [Alphaproteobacteria bacterium]|nr:SPOR domain-containing protein [Alphaproteobacteria bacterium]